MLGLFKKESDIIKEIHDSFDNAQDKLLNEALQIIKSCEDIESQSKAERLKAVGFTSSEVVKNVKKQMQRLVSSKEDAELVSYYKEKYPFQKFLKESQLDEICEKYNLVYAPVSKYLKDVPEKNLRDIECAPNLSESDIIDKDLILVIDKRNSFVSGDRNLYNKAVSTGILVTQRYADEVIIPSVKWIRDYHYNGGVIPFEVRHSFSSFSIKTVNKEGLFIAAPKSHFNTDGMTKNGKFGFMNVTVREVKDPIVFRYCRGGIQVITKWGLEASDPIIVNEIEN